MAGKSGSAISSAFSDAELASSAMRCKDLRRLADSHLRPWAEHASTSDEFAGRLSSGLSKLAAISGSSVRSTACPCDPWKLTSCLTDDENRALASLVAELLVREMKVQQTQQPSAASSCPRKAGSIASADVAVLAAKAAAASLQPRPPPARAQRSGADQHFARVGITLRPVPGAKSKPQRMKRSNSSRVRAVRFAGPEPAPTMSLPPNDKFWTMLASQGLHPLSEEASLLVKANLRHATPRVAPNSITTA